MVVVCCMSGIVFAGGDDGEENLAQFGIPDISVVKSQEQDILIDGKVIRPGLKDFAQLRSETHAKLEQLLGQYTRPATILTIGARQGEYSMRAAQKRSEHVFSYAGR